MERSRSFIHWSCPTVSCATARSDARSLTHCGPVDVDAIWLRVGGISASAGSPAAVKAYIAAAAEFHGWGIPVVADQIGGPFGLLICLPLVRSVGFRMGSRWVNASTMGDIAGPATVPRSRRRVRVYVPALDLMLKPTLAEELVRSSPRNKGMFGCRDKFTVPRGVDDMLGNGGHFMVQQHRMKSRA